jgi:hypothetical protein
MVDRRLLSVQFNVTIEEARSLAVAPVSHIAIYLNSSVRRVCPVATEASWTRIGMRFLGSHLVRTEVMGQPHLLRPWLLTLAKSLSGLEMYMVV